MCELGSLTHEHNVRYDAGEALYDLADLLMSGYKSVHAVNRVLGELEHKGVFRRDPKPALAKLGLTPSDVVKGKWADADSNRGRARRMVTRRGAVALLKTASKRAPPAVGRIVAWLAADVEATADLLPATPHSAEACLNVHMG